MILVEIFEMELIELIENRLSDREHYTGLWKSVNTLGNKTKLHNKLITPVYNLWRTI
jgi:hypothetical protein